MTGQVSVVELAERRGRLAGLEEAAKLADAFETENVAMSTDGIMLDPVLAKLRAGAPQPVTRQDLAESEKHQVHSTIHSSMAHAARNIATEAQLAALAARQVPA